MSPLTQGRGLKLGSLPSGDGQNVAPYAGAWIEIVVQTMLLIFICRPLRRGVD